MKKVIAGISLVLVLGVAVTGTLALFTSMTNEKSNMFTMGKGVSAELREPEWDGIDFGDNSTTPGTGANLGINIAKDFQPGESIPKDPKVKNTSAESVYVAVEITYGSGITSLADLEKFASVNFDTTNWTFNADKTVAFYKNSVLAGSATTPVFSNVKISSSAHNDTQKPEGLLKNFEIKVKGYVVQSDATTGTAEEVLKAAFTGLNK